MENHVHIFNWCPMAPEIISFALCVWKKENIFGSPANCLIAAIENAFRKYHGHMVKLVSLEQKTASLYYMQFPENTSQSTGLPPKRLCVFC